MHERCRCCRDLARPHHTRSSPCLLRLLVIVTTLVAPARVSTHPPLPLQVPAALPASLSAEDASRLHSALAPLAPAIWLNSKLTRYLSGQPPASQSQSHIRATLQRLEQLMAAEQFQLTNTEVMQLINLRPLTLVEVHRLVEECEERLSERHILQLLDVVREGLPEGPNQRKEVEGAEGVEADGGEETAETDDGDDGHLMG